MEKESFENPDVAAIMNRHFVNIKVDREERPDIDKIYMQFVLMVSGSGGWPMSVWLTPDLAPITAGTYFPPRDRWGMSGFVTVLEKIAEMWREKGNELMERGQKIVDLIDKSAKEGESSAEPSQEEFYLNVEQRFNEIVKIYDQNIDSVRVNFFFLRSFLNPCVYLKFSYYFSLFRYGADLVATLNFQKFQN